MSEYLVKQGVHKCFYVIEFKLPFSESDACRCKSLLQLGRYLFQVYYIIKKICTLEAQADVGLENLLCSIQLLFVLLEQLLKSGGELIFSLL